jgi:GDP-L-fucose synthase
MNIWLTSNTGFLGLELFDRLKTWEPETTKLFATNRQQVDLLDSNQVDAFIKENRIDLIVHNAIKGGRRIKQDDSSVVYENILMFENLAKNHKKLFRIINFDSAACFDRRRNIHNCKESELGEHVPIDYYGFSKMNIALRSQQIKNSFNLRIFNCFGPLETPDRMTKLNIKNYIQGKDITVFKNKYMDIFYIDDLYTVLEYYLTEKSNQPKDVNCVYENKITLFDVAEIINNLDKNKSTIKVLQEGLDFSYTGDFSVLKSLNLKFKGLKYGLEYMYKILR